MTAPNTPQLHTIVIDGLPADAAEKVIVAAQRSPPDLEPRFNRRLLRLDSRIRNQFDLITSRTGWLLTSHAFLLGAVAATLNASDAHPAVTAHAMMRAFMLIALPLIGLISSFLVWRSVIGAYRIVDKVKAMRGALLDDMATDFNYEVPDGDARDVRAGDLPPKIFPWLLGAVWLVILAFAVLGLNPRWQAALPTFLH